MKADRKENPKFHENASYSWTKESKWLFNSLTEKTKNTFFYLQEIGYFDTFFPYFTERGDLSSYYFQYTLSGEGVLEYEGKTYTCGKGSCFLIDCRKDHKYYTPEGKTWEFLWIHFNSKQAEGYYDIFRENSESAFMLKDKAIIEMNLKKIMSLYEKITPTSDLITSRLIVEIITDLIIQSNPLASEIKIPLYISTIMEYVQKNYENKISLDELAKISFHSKFYIATQFKKYAGMTINQYIIMQRVNKAKELLHHSEFSVEEISYRVGIGNTSHFIKLFKSIEGYTPSQYRKAWISNLKFS